MEVAVKNLQRKISLNPARISQAARTVLRREGVEEAALSIAFVTSQKITALNRKFLHRHHTTDVLAFDLTQENGKPSKRKKVTKVAGDIVISTDAALRNAREFGLPLGREIALYVIHGILHLLGWDDHGPREVKRMREKEQEVLGYLGSKTKRLVDVG